MTEKKTTPPPQTLPSPWEESLGPDYIARPPMDPPVSTLPVFEEAPTSQPGLPLDDIGFAGGSVDLDRFFAWLREMGMPDNWADQLRGGFEQLGFGPQQPATPAPGSPVHTLPVFEEPEGTQDQRNARAYIQGVLDLYDLGMLGDWAWEQILDGNSPEMILQSLRQQQAYKDRFMGMGIRQELGLPAISEAEYISYERYAAGLMREANMPEEFWDQRQDFAMLIGNDVSLNELNSRITNSYSRVQRAPQIVRDVFGEWFGADGASALAAFFLDPDRAGSILDKMVTQAEIGGYGRTFGLNLSAGRAADITSRGITAQEALRGFQTLEPEASYYDETITESTDLSLEGEGVGATFGLDDTSAEKVRRRKDKRAAAFAGSGGGGVTQQGAVGLGSARR